MKVSVVGTGYVGLSLAVLISRNHEVVAEDIVKAKVDLINSGKSPIVDKEIQEFLSSGKLNLRATTDINDCAGSDFVIVATPTNYDPDTREFDTSSVESVVLSLQKVCPEATVVIKSTIPIGFTEDFCGKNNLDNVIFSPEFLREGRALYDNLHPSRIIAGVPGGHGDLKEKAEEFVGLLKECAEDTDTKTMIMGSTEAESVKLFSNTYLAMRVAYFNELDTFAETNGLSSKEIISGVCMDPRIGDHYNNPSFGYGGYCLPKDSKELLSEYRSVPNSLIGAIVESNAIRKKFIADQIAKKMGGKGTVGVYRLVMKSGSDNFRESSVIDVAKDLESRGFSIIIYEPTLKGKFGNWENVPDLSDFVSKTDLIVANRITPEIKFAQNKLFCRDIYKRD